METRPDSSEFSDDVVFPETYLPNAVVQDAIMLTRTAAILCSIAM